MFLRSLLGINTFFVRPKAAGKRSSKRNLFSLHVLNAINFNVKQKQMK